MIPFPSDLPHRMGESNSMSKVNRILIITIATALALTATLFLSYSPTRAQDSVDSADLARFVVLMQHIRSQPTPADVRATNVPALAGFDSFFSDIYITGFITPFTGETPEQVKARLQSVPDEDRFTAVMVESYRLASNPLLLNIMHNLLARYYVDYFTTSDLGGASDFLKRTEITSLADGFDSMDYAIPAPSATGTASTPAQGQANVDSADLAKFAALMQHIRSQPTPADVRAANVPVLAGFDSFFSDIYITGFITPFTGETPEQVKARLQSVPDEDRFTAVMVESYRLSSNPLLLNIIHNLLARYYVDYFTTSDLGGASDFLKRTEITSLADSFDSTSYTIPAPSTTQIPTTPAADRAALTALYNATDGPNWTNNTNWLSDRPLGEWFGVSADSAGRVTRLDLSKNQLTGAIPPELGSLDKLTWLSLWENQLTGSIPPELPETLNLGQPVDGFNSARTRRSH